MDLYARQVMHRKWLVAAEGDLRIVEAALARVNAAALISGQKTSSAQVLEQIRIILADRAMQDA